MDGPVRRAIPQRGFTLMEILITLVLVGIVAAVAYPSYQSTLMKSRRSDAKSGLLAGAQALERFFTERGTYVGATLGSDGIYPSTSTNGYYTLSLASQSATAFSLKATPTGVQSGDACGSFTYDQTGTKGISGGSLDAASCW